VATLDNSGLSEEVLKRLWNPIEGPPDVNDPDIRLAIRFWIESLEVGQDNYHKSQDAVLHILQSIIPTNSGEPILTNSHNMQVGPSEPICTRSPYQRVGP
jgi:hypothetical protein